MFKSVITVLAILTVVHGRGFFQKKSDDGPSNQLMESMVQIGVSVIEDIIQSELEDLRRGVKEKFSEQREEVVTKVRECAGKVEPGAATECVKNQVRDGLQLSTKVEQSILGKVEGLSEYFSVIHKECGEQFPEDGLCGEGIEQFGECALTEGDKLCVAEYGEYAEECKKGVRWVCGRGQQLYEEECQSMGDKRALLNLLSKLKKK